MISVVNVSKRSLLAGRVTRLASAWRSLASLVSHPELYPGEGLLLEGGLVRPAKSVDTRFLRFPIDIVFADAQGRVVASVSGVKPFVFVPLPPGTERVIKLPLGAVGSSLTTRGDILEVVEAEGGKTA